MILCHIIVLVEATSNMHSESILWHHQWCHMGYLLGWCHNVENNMSTHHGCYPIKNENWHWSWHKKGPSCLEVCPVIHHIIGFCPFLWKLFIRMASNFVYGFVMWLPGLVNFRPISVEYLSALRLFEVKTAEIYTFWSLTSDHAIFVFHIYLIFMCHICGHITFIHKTLRVFEFTFDWSNGFPAWRFWGRGFQHIISAIKYGIIMCHKFNVTSNI